MLKSAFRPYFMKKIIAILCCLLLVAVSVAPAALCAEHGDYDYYIEDYNISMTANSDRSYDVVETIKVFFNEESHGIFRKLNRSSSVESYKIKNLAAVGDNFSFEGDNEIRIGDADIMLTGEKTYTITYRLEHYADPHAESDYLYFDVIGTEWDVPIDHFSATVNLPQAAQVKNINLTSGRYGSTGNDYARYTQSGGVISLESNGQLPQNTGVTIKVEMNEGAFADAVPYMPAVNVKSLNTTAELDSKGLLHVKESYVASANPSLDSEGFVRRLSAAYGSGERITDIKLNGAEQSEYIVVPLTTGVETAFTIEYTVDFGFRAGVPIDIRMIIPICSERNDYSYEKIAFDFSSPFPISSGSSLFHNYYDNENNVFESKLTEKGYRFETSKPILANDLELTLNLDNVTLDYSIQLFDIIFPLIALLLLAAAVIRLSKRKGKPLVPSVQFYPPDGLNPAFAGYVCGGSVSGRDIVSYLYYWASHGHLSIEMPDDDSFILHRLTPLDEAHDPSEAEMYAKLFELGDGEQVSDKKLTNRFYKHVNNAAEAVGQHFTGELELNKTGKIKGQTNIGLKAIPFFIFGFIALTTVTPFVGYLFASFSRGGAVMFLGMCLLLWLFVRSISMAFLRRGYSGKKPMTWLAAIITVVIAVAAALVGILMAAGYSMAPVTVYAGTAILFLSAFLWPRSATLTDYGVEVLGRVIGFKSFLTLAEKDQLELLLSQNPHYYYDILPYAQTLKVSSIWREKFDDLLTEPPEWVYGPGFNNVNSLIMLDMLTSQMQTTSVSAPQSSGGSSGGGFGSGGFGGGGFSGGGSGGGGGGRW